MMANLIIGKRGFTMTDEEIGKRVKEGKYVLYTFYRKGNGAMIPQFVMIGDRPFIGDVKSIEEERKKEMNGEEN